MDDKSPAGYMLVDEYLSDDFASGCEDDKCLREGKAVNQTRRQKGQLRNWDDKRFRSVLSSTAFP